MYQTYKLQRFIFSNKAPETVLAIRILTSAYIWAYTLDVISELACPKCADIFSMSSPAYNKTAAFVCLKPCIHEASAFPAVLPDCPVSRLRQPYHSLLSVFSSIHYHNYRSISRPNTNKRYMIYVFAIGYSVVKVQWEAIFPPHFYI